MICGPFIASFITQRNDPPKTNQSYPFHDVNGDEVMMMNTVCQIEFALLDSMGKCAKNYTIFYSNFHWWIVGGRGQASHTWPPFGPISFILIYLSAKILPNNRFSHLFSTHRNDFC